MTTINSIGNSGQLPETTKNTENKEPEYNNSIFKDSNNDGIINEEDFQNNKTLIGIIDRNGWLGEKWSEFGNAVNKLLKSFNAESKEDGQEISSKIVENRDIKNGSELTLTINALRNEATFENISWDDFNNTVKNLFGDQLQQLDVLRDGGSLKITLKDGTKIEIDYSMFSEEQGFSTITKPDGSTERFDSDGNSI
ncbi:MAG: hypothetical protein NC408_09595 [Candidatus Gastranaerophilales bacterium]|nr:hypothetical protein [Candidatus Gastranaerophilales bacterium]